MSIDKPWEKDFDNLLSELHAHWPSGTTTVGKEVDQAGASSSIWQYPRFVVELHGLRYVISIAEFPIGSADILDSTDNVEYLRIEAVSDLNLSLTLRHEGFYDRFRKKFLFAYEYQTGVADFDRNYLIEAQTDVDRRLVSTGEFQRFVRELEPFANLALLKHTAGWSQELHGRNQLQFEVVTERVRQFSDCVVYARSFQR